MIDPRRSVMISIAVPFLLCILPVVSMASVADSVDSTSDIQATVDDVLARPAYTGIGENPISSFMRSNPISLWISEQIQRFIDWLSSFGGSDPSIPGTEQDPQRSSGLLSVLILTVVLAVGVAYVLVSRRQRDEAAPDAREAEAMFSESELMGLAALAEEAGDYEQAVRLRFQAGLDTLDRLGAIDASPSTATGTVRREVSLDEFDAVANVFEVATYSEYQATDVDADLSRQGWSDVFRVLDRSAEPRDPE